MMTFSTVGNESVSTPYAIFAVHTELCRLTSAPMSSVNVTVAPPASARPPARLLGGTVG